MNKYDKSRSESQHQQNYATNAQQEQKADEIKKSYNPLYPETDDGEAIINDEEANIQQDSEESDQAVNNDQDQQELEENNKNN